MKTTIGELIIESTEKIERLTAYAKKRGSYSKDIEQTIINQVYAEKVFSEEEIIKARHHVQVFINIDRDLHNKVTMDDVNKGLDEFLKILKIGEQK